MWNASQNRRKAKCTGELKPTGRILNSIYIVYHWQDSHILNPATCSAVFGGKKRNKWSKSEENNYGCWPCARTYFILLNICSSPDTVVANGPCNPFSIFFRTFVDFGSLQGSHCMGLRLETVPCFWPPWLDNRGKTNPWHPVLQGDNNADFSVSSVLTHVWVCARVGACECGGKANLLFQSKEKHRRKYNEYEERTKDSGASMMKWPEERWDHFKGDYTPDPHTPASLSSTPTLWSRMCLRYSVFSLWSQACRFSFL